LTALYKALTFIFAVMESRLAFLLRYINYYFKAETRQDVHSPFVYTFIEEVLRDKRTFYDFGKIENIRSQLLGRHEVISITDFGAGSLVHTKGERKISDIARFAAKSPKYAQLLFRIVNYFQPQRILEMGTSLGISSAYLGLANPQAKLVTLEGCEPIAEIAKENFNQLQLKNIEQINGNFDSTLQIALQKLQRTDLAFIDGNHRQEPTLNYFEKILPTTHNDSVIIFDDIHWTKDMEAAWKEIKNHPAVKISLDLFFIGIVFFKKEFKEKQHFILRY
jgi:predicted O-methyltransferase YrrM